MAIVTNITDVLEGHVALEIECVDRPYLNAYVPNLQVGGQVVRVLRDHLGNQIPSPALLGPIGNRFRILPFAQPDNKEHEAQQEPSPDVRILKRRDSYVRIPKKVASERADRGLDCVAASLPRCELSQHHG